MYENIKKLQCILKPLQRVKISSKYPKYLFLYFLDSKILIFKSL